MHKPILIQNISYSYPTKNCFEHLSARIVDDSRIGLIGKNGCGKSTLLKILNRTLDIHHGHIHFPDDITIGYVPQIIQSHDELSGGQRFNAYLHQVLATNPHCLLLDEPTNHLDRDNRLALIHTLKHFAGSVIVASHDVALLNTCVDSLWHIDNERVTLFNGRHADFLQEMSNKKIS